MEILIFFLTGTHISKDLLHDLTSSQSKDVNLINTRLSYLPEYFFSNHLNAGYTNAEKAKVSS